MLDFLPHIKEHENGYRLRIMMSIVVVELLLIITFNIRSSTDYSANPNNVNFTEDAIAIEDIVRTEQQNSPPPPPKPEVPIPEPTDKVIEEEIVELEDLNISEYSDSLSLEMIGSDGDADEPVSSPQVAPQVVHIVEPTVPDEAKKTDIKAEIWVNFLVDTQGKVEEASISKITLYDQQSGEPKTVDRIDYGLTKATLNAALQWKFRPARNNGEPVKAYSKQVFSYGF